MAHNVLTTIRQSKIAFRLTYQYDLRAFTLIEFLMVLTILSLLAALLLPVLSQTIDSGRDVACKSNLKQIGVIFHMYANNHSQYLPAYTDYASPGAPPLILYMTRAGYFKMGTKHLPYGWPYEVECPKRTH